MTAGRPLKFQSVDDMKSLLDAYFAERSADGLPITITGMCMALDITRETFANYEKIEEFSATVKMAKLAAENYAENMLYVGKNATGPIFALKNFGWTDSQNLNIGGQDGNPLNATVEFVGHNKDT